MNPTERNHATGPVRSDTNDREITVSRTIHVPRRFVFEAWTQERHISRWLGPDGFTITTRRFEFRPGGVWEFTMHGPDGTGGNPLFEPSDARTRLQLLEARPMASGVVILRCQPDRVGPQ